MALTIGTPSYWVRPGVRGVKVGTVAITFDNSYPTAGEPIVYSDIPGLATSLTGLVAIASNAEEYTYQYDSTNGKICVHAVGAEVGNTTDLSALITTFFFIGY